MGKESGRLAQGDNGLRRTTDTAVNSLDSHTLVLVEKAYLPLMIISYTLLGCIPGENGLRVRRKT